MAIQRDRSTHFENIESCELLVLDDLGAEYVRKDKDGEESWLLT
ncbi:hypothetical protein [Bacillus velezensis]|nr:hypothetical protein [Bacillus velezensis]